MESTGLARREDRMQSASGTVEIESAYALHGSKPLSGQKLKVTVA